MDAESDSTRSLAPFKTNGTISSENFRMRPFVGPCCPKCLPVSRVSFADDPLSTPGMSNMLRVPTQNGNRNIFTRTFYYASFVMTRRTDSHFPDVSKKVMKCERVQSAIRSAAADEMEEMRARIKKVRQLNSEASFDRNKVLFALEVKHKSRAVAILRRMKSCISSSLLRIAGWILYKLLSVMLTTIQFHKGQIEKLKKVKDEKRAPIIYLPMHRSHLDYILVSFILYMNDIKPPLIAAGDNLLIPFFGNLMRGLGAFFIKRRLEPKEGKKDYVYRSILHSYMTENLKEGMSLEFFIEGGRSRTGKACLPKSGLLSVIVDAVLDGVIDDAYIVPVGISYEKLIDGNFVAEQLGKPKVMENFTLAAKAIWSKLHSVFGSVRVDFSEPYSLKEYLRGAAINMHNLNRYTENEHIGECLTSFPCVACSSDINGRALRPTASNTSLYGLDIVVSEDKRQMIADLSEHIVYDAFNNMALMSTQLLSFLLLTKHRKGATIQQLTQSMNWLREELIRRKRDVGFTGESSEIIRHACRLLGKELVSTETVQMAWSSSGEFENNNVKFVFLKPAIKTSFILELQYYSNTVISVFLLESVVVNALFAALETELEALSGTEFSNKTIDRSHLVSKSLELCNMLQYDFIFAPPCTNLRTVIDDAIDHLVERAIIVDVNPRKPVHIHEDIKALEFDDEENDDGYLGGQDTFSQQLGVNLSDESISYLKFLRVILSPYIESYWMAACSLIKLINKQKVDRVFFEEVLENARERLQKGLLCFDESVAADSLKNAVRLFESWKVIESTSHDSVRVVYLSKAKNNDEAINDIILRFEKFKK